MTTKTHTHYLILNLKNGDAKIRKTPPKKTKLGPHEKSIKLNITINEPKDPPITANINIDLDKKTIQKMTADKL